MDFAARFPPCSEQDLIEAILRLMLDPGHPTPTPVANLDWGRFFELLTRHQLTGLFYVWGKTRRPFWPAEIDQQMGRQRYQALFWSDRFTPHAQRVLGSLHKAGIPVIVLKGWAFIQSIYGGDASQRPYADIDLLVPPGEAARAEALFQGLGYPAQTAEPWAGHIRRFRNGRAFLSGQPLSPFPQKFMAGLHWGLLDTPYYQRRVNVSGLFERAQPLMVAGVPVLRLDLTDALPYAWGHLALHHEYDPALLRYFEFAWLIRNAGSDLDWAGVLNRARTWHLTIPTQTILARIAALSPGTVPAGVLAEAAALRPTWSERLIHDWVVRQRGNAALRALLAWLSMPGVGRRLRYLAETAFPSPAYMQARYGRAPGGFWPLLYLLRFSRGADQGAALIKKKKGRGQA
jgi:hypothetical protein